MCCDSLLQEIPLSEAGKYKDAEWDISKINRMYAQKEDRQMINEFRENFLMNLGKVGSEKLACLLPMQWNTRP